jgi:hypothetical protein
MNENKPETPIVETDLENEEFGSGGYTRETRPSPSVSATLYDEGYIKRGNDGFLWKITVASNQVHRWQKLSGGEQSQYEEGDIYGQPKSYAPPVEEKEQKSTFTGSTSKTENMEEDKDESLPFYQMVNKALTRSMFHYQVGDTISSAVGQPFLYKGKISHDKDGDELNIRLEPSRQLNSPNFKFIQIKIYIDRGTDTIGVKVEYHEVKNLKHKVVMLWEGGGDMQGFDISDMGRLDSIIRGHKGDMKDNFEKGQEAEATPIEETKTADKKYGIDDIVSIIDEPVSHKNLHKVIGHGNYNKEYGWETKIQNVTNTKEVVTMYENLLQLESKSEQMETTETTSAESEVMKTTEEVMIPALAEIGKTIMSEKPKDALAYNKNCRKIIDEYKKVYRYFPFVDEAKKEVVQVSAEVLNYLSGYTGMGGLKFEEAGKEILYEYYTPDEIIQRMWGLAYKHGYKEDGSVLEPSVATGRFLKYANPVTRVVACELNWYSYCIATLIYGHKFEIRQQYFEEFFIKNNNSIKGKVGDLEKFDLVIGNPPYGNFQGKYAGMGEKSYTRARNQVEYFILRGLDLLKKDGLLVYIIGAEVSAGGIPFLDGQMSPVKEMISERGELIDAYRLPNDVFDTTSVLSDIIVIKKK